MKHPNHIVGYSGSIKGCARDVSNLNSDNTIYFLETLAADFVDQGMKDEESGRVKLATELYESAVSLYEILHSIPENKFTCNNTNLKNFNGTLEDCARAVGNMSYDKTKSFLECLSNNLAEEIHTEKLAQDLDKPIVKINKAWQTCEPYMN